MMNRKSTSVTVVMFILSLLVFSASSFAWFALSNSARVNEFIVPVNEYKALITFDVSKNGGAPQTIATETQMTAFLNNALPGDRFDFLVTITNLSTSTVQASIYLQDILSNNPNPGYDMRNVFYLVDGEITVGITPIELPLNSTEDLIFEDQTFSDYRLSNLMDASNDIKIITDVTVPITQAITISFAIMFDLNTEKKEYQAGSLSITSLLAVFDT